MNKENKKVLIVIPTYNERDNIKRLIEEILGIDPGYYILVVDDKSPDGTWEMVRDLEKQNPQVKLLLREGPRGRGLAGIDGFRYALDLGADYIIEMDADFSHHPRYIPDLLKGLENADFVLGSRFVPGGKDIERGIHRKLISKLANGYARWLMGVKIRDCTSGFRAYRRQTLEGIKISEITTWGPAVLSDILYRIQLKGYSMAEVPITFYERSAGQSTLTARILLEGLWNILRLRLAKRRILKTLER